MLGAVVGDVIGSAYEWNNVKWTDFDLFTPLTTFTDDSILTLATADSIMTGIGYEKSYRELGNMHPGRGYGSRFLAWLNDPFMEAYRSWGNGSAMRVSPVGLAFDDEKEVLREARRSAEVTHDHREGIKGAQATALAVYMARKGSSKEDIRTGISERFGYDLARTVDEIRPGYTFDESCQGTVPEAIVAFLDSGSFEEAVRLAVSLGGDSDTVACIAGAIAHAFYREIPEEISSRVRSLLPRDLTLIMDRFCDRYGV